MKQFIRSLLILSLCGIALLLPVVTSFAEKKQAQKTETNAYESQQEREFVTRLNAALSSAKEGPATIFLANQASLKIPDNYLFFPQKEAAALMKAMGNSTNAEFLGLIVSRIDQLRWFITVSFVDSGYLRDDDAKSWTADGLMAHIKEGNNEANKERVANGFPPLEIVGWVEQPNYDESTRRLVWSILVRDKVIGNDNEEPMVNYNTYVLGREGYFKLDLVTSKSSIEQYQPIVHKLLPALNFTDGKRYQDFNEKTDRIAEYGLAALITGIAAKKLGLLAIAGAFFIKMWKLVFLIPLLWWGRIKKLLGLKTKDDTSKADTSK